MELFKFSKPLSMSSISKAKYKYNFVDLRKTDTKPNRILHKGFSYSYFLQLMPCLVCTASLVPFSVQKKKRDNNRSQAKPFYVVLPSFLVWILSIYLSSVNLIFSGCKEFFSCSTKETKIGNFSLLLHSFFSVFFCPVFFFFHSFYSSKCLSIFTHVLRQKSAQNNGKSMTKTNGRKNSTKLKNICIFERYICLILSVLCRCLASALCDQKKNSCNFRIWVCLVSFFRLHVMAFWHNMFNFSLCDFDKEFRWKTQIKRIDKHYKNSKNIFSTKNDFFCILMSIILVDFTQALIMSMMNWHKLLRRPTEANSKRKIIALI